MDVTETRIVSATDTHEKTSSVSSLKILGHHIIPESFPRFAKPISSTHHIQHADTLQTNPSITAEP